MLWVSKKTLTDFLDFLASTCGRIHFILLTFRKQHCTGMHLPSCERPLEVSNNPSSLFYISFCKFLFSSWLFCYARENIAVEI